MKVFQVIVVIHLNVARQHGISHGSHFVLGIGNELFQAGSQFF